MKIYEVQEVYKTKDTVVLSFTEEVYRYGMKCKTVQLKN